MGKIGAAVSGFWSDYPWVDYLVALSFSAVHAFLVIRYGILDYLSPIELGQRVSVYGTGAALAAIFGGLGSIAVTVYISATGSRAVELRRGFKGELRRNWSSIIAGIALASFLCLVAQIADDDSGSWIPRSVFTLAISLAVLRFLRLWWLLNSLMAVSDHDLAEIEDRAPAPKVDPNWGKR